MWVLVVDDSPSSVLFISQALRSLGHSVMTCSDAAAGLETLRSMATDVALVDYHMPGMNALGFISSLRSQLDHPSAKTPIIVMTADAAPAIAQSALSSGATAVLHKPLDLGGLAAALDAAATNSSR